MQSPVVISSQMPEACGDRYAGMSGRRTKLYVAFRIATFPIFGNKAKSLKLGRFVSGIPTGQPSKTLRLALDNAKE